MAKLSIISLLFFANQVIAQENESTINTFVETSKFDSERFLLSEKFERLMIENDKKPGTVTTFSLSGKGVWAYLRPTTKASTVTPNVEKISAKGDLAGELAMLFVYSPHYMGLLEKMEFAPKWSKGVKVEGLGICNSVSFMGGERRLVTYYFSPANNSLLASEYDSPGEGKKAHLVKYSDWRMVEGTKVFMYHRFAVSVGGEDIDAYHIRRLEQELDSVAPAKQTAQPTMESAAPISED